MTSTIKYQIINQEFRSFITNTNNLYSINNGPWPNTALQYMIYLFGLKKFSCK